MIQEAKVTPDVISATMTYVAWCEGRLWKVGVLREYTFSFVFKSPVMLKGIIAFYSENHRRFIKHILWT